jgi:hypothetical protein
VAVDDRNWRFQDELVNAGQSPVIWRGSKVQFEFAFFFGTNASNRTLVTDFSDLATITVGAKATNNKSGPFIIPSKTVTVASIIQIAGDDWASNDQAKAQITIALSDAETNVAPGQYWLEVSALDTTGENVMLGATTLTVEESGIGGENTPVDYPGYAFPYFLLTRPNGKKRRITLVDDADGNPTLQISDTDID